MNTTTNPGTQVAQPRQEHWLQSWARSSLPDVLPAHLTPDKVVRVALAEFARKPDLANCDKGSICLSIMTASQLGLEVASPLGEAYLIPRKGLCQLQIGYKGYLKLLRNSGEIRTVIAECVYDGEAFTVEVDTTRDNSIEVKHSPDYLGARDPRRIVAAYCIVQTKDGGRYVAVCSRSEIEDRRKRGASGMGRSSPWDTDYGAMARKTAIRKLLVGGTVPMSTELARAVEHELADDDRVYEDTKPRPAARLLDVIEAPAEAQDGHGVEE